MRKYILGILTFIILIAGAVSVSIVLPSTSLAFMVKGPASTPAISKSVKRTVPTKAGFLGWRGNKLFTTAGTFTITKSVKLVDLAGTMASQTKTYPNNAPLVHLFYKNNRLVKVIIK